MPSKDSYGQDIDLWALTDAPSIPDALRALADGVIPRVVLRYASASERSATLQGSLAPVKGMVTWLNDVNRLEVYNGSSWVTPPPTLSTVSSGLTVRSGFSLTDWSGYRENRHIMIDIYLSRTGSAITENNGNIPDTEACVIPSAWRPTHGTVTGIWDNGFVSGGFTVGTDGVVTLRTATGNLNTGTNLRFHICYLRTT